VEFSATQLRRFIRAAIEGNSLLEENEALSNENAMLKRNNDTLMKNLEVDWPSRKEAVELEFQRLQDSEGKASVHACSGGLPSLGRR
jgi:hypothetical protein